MSLEGIISNALEEASRKKFTSRGMVADVLRQIEEHNERSYSEKIIEGNPDQQTPTASTAEEGMAAADAHANEAWKKRCDEVIRAVCRSKEYFTSDDIREELDKYPEKTRYMQALGPAMRRASLKGWCRVTETFKTCKAKTRHSPKIPVWFSLLFPSSHE